MPSLVPRYAITVVRGDKHIIPPIGKAFDFTAEEVKAVRKHMHDALRKPVNESDATVAQSETDAAMRGMEVPEMDDARDANLLSRAKPKGNPKKVRTQGGGIEEDRVANGGRREEDDEPVVPADEEDL